MRRTLIIMVGFSVLLVGAGCGDKDKGSEGLRGREPCASTPSPIPDPSFSSGFPEIGDVTWTADQSAGPSRVINGYTGDALDDLYKEMKEKFAEGGYSVTKAEHDPHDAEVNFSSPQNTGQVALAEECQGRTSVRLTIRPK
jgi:hypothetical protein